jgi:hypothetical protein
VPLVEHLLFNCGLRRLSTSLMVHDYVVKNKMRLE